MGVHYRPLIFCVTSASLLVFGLATLAQSPPDLPTPRAAAERPAGVAAMPLVLPSPPVPAARPKEWAVPCTPIPKKPVDGDKLAHLRQAAQHLSAAGMTELAGQVQKAVVLEEKMQQLQELQQEVNRLQSPKQPEQVVMIELKVLELQVTKMRELGFDFQFADGSGGAQFTESTLFESEACDGLLEALRAHKLVKVLAEPTLVTVSGRPASFRSGGEFPIVVPQKSDKVAVEYRQFGTSLDCVATVVDHGKVRLEVRATISEIDTSRSVEIQGNSVPGLRTRMMDTAVELQTGKTFVLSGLTESHNCKDADPSKKMETAMLFTFTVNLGDAVARTEEADVPTYR